MTKISDLTALTGAGVDDATDLLPIVDMSEAGAARNKKITIDETRIALGLSSSDSPQFTALNLGHASDTTISRVSAGVVAIEGVNIVTTAGGVTFAADIIVPDEAYDATAWNGSLEVPTKNAVRDKIEALSVGGGIDVQDEGVAEATGATTLNFTGAGVTATDMGGGVVDVDIPGGGSSTSAWKEPVRVATIVAGTLASDFENGDTVDGVVLATGDRILIKDQATASENGIYTVNASGAPTRATDADAGSELLGAATFVSEGTVNADTVWTCTNNATITVNTTGLVFVRVGSDWKLVGSNSPSAVANVDFTNLGGYNELLVIARALTASVSGVRCMQVSTDNGSTFDTTAANYQIISTAGVEANSAAFMAYHATASTAARTLLAHIRNLKGAVKSCVFKGTDTEAIYVGSANDINAIRVICNNGGTISGGPIYVYGR